MKAFLANLSKFVRYQYHAWRFNRLRKRHAQAIRFRLTQQGFTLIELMIAVAIVAILAAIALPAYSAFATRGDVSEGLNLAQSMEAAVASTFQSSGTVPNSEAAAGIPGDLAGKYVGNVALYDGGAVVVTYAAVPIAPAPIAGTKLVFKPYLTADGQSLAWQCGYSSPGTGWTLPAAGTDQGGGGVAPASTTPAGYLPKSCAAGG